MNDVKVTKKKSAKFQSGTRIVSSPKFQSPFTAAFFLYGLIVA